MSPASRAAFLRQTWLDLLFLHWPVPAGRLQPLVPPGLTVQEFRGTSWIGVVPFFIKDLGVRQTPISLSFAELNLRIYVEADGVPGVWFLSLDAASRLAVMGARAAFNLPYWHARMAHETSAGVTRFRSVRRGSWPTEVGFDGEFGPTGPAQAAAPNTLDYFLTERYCLYTVRRGRLERLMIAHPPWALQPADATIERNTLAEPFGITLDGPPAAVHFSRRQDVDAWWPAPIAGG